MSLKEILLQDMKAAMKDKDTIKKNTVQLVRAAILQFEKDNKETLDDEGIFGIISKEVKKRKDVLPEYEKIGRTESIEEINREISILMDYLPKQLSEQELTSIIQDVVNEIGASGIKDMGKVMSAVMPKITGRADGKTVNSLVKEILNR